MINNMKIKIEHEVRKVVVEFMIEEIMYINHIITSKNTKGKKRKYSNIHIENSEYVEKINKPYIIEKIKGYYLNYPYPTFWCSIWDDEDKKMISEKAKMLAKKKFPESYH
jgi:hypothetical protein